MNKKAATVNQSLKRKKNGVNATCNKLQLDETLKTLAIKKNKRENKLKEVQQETNKLTYESAFDTKLEKFSNEDTTEEVTSTVKFETINKNDTNFEGSAVLIGC